MKAYFIDLQSMEIEFGTVGTIMKKHNIPMRQRKQIIDAIEDECEWMLWCDEEMEGGYFFSESMKKDVIKKWGNK